MKTMLQNGTALLALLFYLGGCSLQTTLTTKPKTNKIAQKNTHQTWKTNIKKLRHGEPLTSFSPTCTNSPFTFEIPKSTQTQNLDCIDFHPPYLHDFSIQDFENQYDVVRDEMVDFAKKYLGLRYRSAGTSPKTGFDCSGFTHYIMKNFGVDISPSSRAQATEGEKISIDEARKGDLLFFGYRSKSGNWRVSHAAMVISEKDEDLAMIHSCRRGIVIDDIHSGSWRSYYKKRFLFAKRVIQNSEKEDVSSASCDLNVANQF